FTTILIANRGEIACRVIRTARAMGIATVAVYSDADKGALHVQKADVSVNIGPPPARDSYLDMERIVQACRETGAQAIHPGYGFLSENPEFCKLLEQESITFIGPPPGAITAMGDKITSKKIAAEAGVNTIPGFDGIISDKDHAVKVARETGYPVMLKASAGGGGKGIRVARDDRECREGFERCASEAMSCFGDDRILIEKFIEEPRHIEIQIMADTHGNIIYLGERECSIQRRHQKIIEEAPSPFIDAATRRAMGEQAVALARAVNYVSAGTVEFIVDQERNFYFLEMNTRLQVEHPVTEMVTGLDLVELMIKVAAGEKLPLSQKDVKLNGSAVECRIYAENPLRDFLPSIGRLVYYQPPEQEAERIRVDSGVFEGGEISMYYDPMIAKLITWGEDRDSAIRFMRDALDEYLIRGIKHNIGFLAAIMAHPRFREGRLSTNFIAQEYPDGFRREDIVQDDPALRIVVLSVMHRLYMDRAARLSGQLAGHERRVMDEWVVIIDNEHHPVKVSPFQAKSEHHVEYQGEHYTIHTDWCFCQPLFRGTINGQSCCFQVKRRGIRYAITHRGLRTNGMVMTPRAAELYRIMPVQDDTGLSGFLLAPMPGLLVKLAVEEGQEVQAGEELAVIEAMKMENVLRATRDGVVSKIVVKLGDSLHVDQVILEME
ncbi:MAG TPA: acetyl/propionyl/methylcrotonyl-CoA carboxylase subunit alpha, partial [Desulfobacteraceae bacterium]|nr:acetyl/propionyl/methylcrotonyl-CoA carboxylase subunit alpha [Desulfobacteraceae bacterium]